MTRANASSKLTSALRLQARGSCVAAGSAAAHSMADLQGILDACRLLARALLLRQLLAAAVAAEAASAVPEAAAALEAAAQLGPARRDAHVCDLLGLPRPSGSKVGEACWAGSAGNLKCLHGPCMQPGRATNTLRFC